MTTPTPSEVLPLDPNEPVLTVDVGAGGAGDTIALCWLAEGYKQTGRRMVLATVDKGRARMVTMFGQETLWDVSTPLKAGGNAPWYAPLELTKLRGSQSRLRVWGSAMPGQPTPVRPPFLPDPVIRAEMEGLIGGMYGEEPFVLIFPWVAWAGRRWPLANWIEMADILRRRGVPCLFTTDAGPRGDNIRRLKNGPSWLKFIYGYGWEHNAIVCQKAGAVVGVDSSGAWLAATVGAPTIALMGPTKNVFGGIPNVEEMSVGTQRQWCTGCMFQRDSGYRDSCGYACQALLELKPGEVADRLYEKVKGGARALPQLEVLSGQSAT